MSEYAMVGAFVCCILIIVGIAVGVKVGQNVQESCSSAPFHDLPNEFREEEQYFSTRSRSKLFALFPNNTQLGSFTTRPAAFKTSYSYRDYTDNVVAEAKKGSLSFTFTINRCESAASEKSPRYELERHFFVFFGQVDYDLRKDGVLIGRPSKSSLFACRPDVVIKAMDGSLLAVLDRSCAGSLFKDNWKITNYQPNIVENYVLGMIAYITTGYENEEDAQKNKKN